MTAFPVRIRRSALVPLLAVISVATALFSVRPAQATHGLFNGQNPGIWLHWPAFSTFDQVTFVDRTQPWPVTTATKNWDRSDAFIPAGIVHYHWWNCTHAVHCVQVNEVDDEDLEYLGTSSITFTISTGHVLESSFITLNNFYVPSGCGGETASVCRRHTICQEIGHILDLDHQTGPSCMDDTDISELTPEYKNSGHDDHDQINGAYLYHGYPD